MALKETIIHSVMVGAAFDTRTIVLKQKGAECYLPICVNRAQADILGAELLGQSDENEVNRFVPAIAKDKNTRIKSVKIHLRNNFFSATLEFDRDVDPREAGYPIGQALALGYGAHAPILVDEELFYKAGVALPS